MGGAGGERDTTEGIGGESIVRNDGLVVQVAERFAMHSSSDEDTVASINGSKSLKIIVLRVVQLRWNSTIPRRY